VANIFSTRSAEVLTTRDNAYISTYSYIVSSVNKAPRMVVWHVVTITGIQHGVNIIGEDHSPEEK